MILFCGAQQITFVTFVLSFELNRDIAFSFQRRGELLLLILLIIFFPINITILFVVIVERIVKDYLFTLSIKECKFSLAQLDGLLNRLGPKQFLVREEERQQVYDKLGRNECL